MSHPASEKLEIIRLVEQSHLPVRRTCGRLLCPVPHSIAGSTKTESAARMGWRTELFDPAGFGAAVRGRCEARSSP